VTAAQEVALWALLAIAPGNRINAYDFRTNTFYTVEAYKLEGAYIFADKESGLDIRKWGPQQPYEQTVVRYRKDVLSPLNPPRRSVERYDGYGALIEPEQTWPQ
jgi:hypothetical protein